MYRRTLVSLLIAITFPIFALASDLAYPPNVNVKGRTMAELANDWWQWAMSIPDDVNPVRDLSGGNCGLGQNGEVWFLAGGFGSSKIRRTCSVPEGVTLFFPLINMVYWSRNEKSADTCEKAKASAALNNETALDLFVEIDGVTIDGLKRYRVASKNCFNVFARIPQSQRPYNAYPSASDGFWLLLKPLSKGHHHLKFGGRYNRNSPEYGRMVQDIEYELIVK